MIGATISHYHILEKLGGGGMGVVYKAEDTKLKRTVALKFLPPEVTRDEEAKERFIHEAQAASALDHPNICDIHDIGETDDGQLFIVMTCYEGETLKKKIEHGPLKIEEAVEICIQVAQGLQKAHEHGIVHRDIKAANVMITSDGIAKIVDFGLAKLSGQTVLTKAGTTVGTAAYMSPEQARGEPVDHRTDIWSLGVVMYEMISGRLPFAGEYEQAIVYLILNEEPEPMMSAQGNVPAGLERIVEKALAKSDSKRYQHIGEMAAELQTLRKELEAGVAKPRLIKLRIPRKKRPYVYGAVAVLLATIVATRLFLPRGGFETIDSLAVLPLENLSGDPAQDYLASGIHEALITDLAKLSGLRRVTARSSVKRFENSTLAPKQIARELGVDALVTGSVLRSGNRVQITAHLISASTETGMWSERYDREFRDVLSLENEIVSAITRAINLQLTPQEQVRLKSQRPVNPEAYEACLQGRFYWLKQTREDFDLAERYFQLGLEKDSNYALAYAGLANVWMTRADAGFQPPSETFPKASAFLAKALELDESLAELRVDLANQKAATQWDWSGAEKEFKRAIEINPNLADAHFFYADLLLALKRPEEWNREVQRALELDPLNDFKKSFYGWHLNYLRRYDEAIPIFQKLLPTGPNKASNYLGLWGAYYKKGMYDEALAAAKDYFVAIGDRKFADALGTGGGKVAYRAGMKRAGEVMVEHSKRRHVPGIRVARMFAHAGDNNQALRWLEKAYQDRESPLMRLGVFWDWDDLRSDPRFQDLLRRMNLPLGK